MSFTQQWIHDNLVSKPGSARASSRPKSHRSRPPSSARTIKSTGWRLRDKMTVFERFALDTEKQLDQKSQHVHLPSPAEKFFNKSSIEQSIICDTIPQSVHKIPSRIRQDDDMIPIEDHLQLVEEEISKRTNQLTNIFQQKLRQETLNSDHQKRLISKEHAKDMEALMREYDVKIAGLNRKLNENRNNLDRIVKLEDDIALSDNHVTRLERKIGDARLLLRAQNDAAVRAQKMIDKRHREEIIQYQETVRGLEKKVNELEESLLKKGITAEPRRVAFPASGPASKPRIRRAPQQVMSALGAINLLASGNG
eukprot:TRINITY_DN1962_c0_g1_i2.p1 TRINITY_DN1962_c0_g1~~TRINITY_DN1962_c0_g1_i2.p1  ORF type:complete len:310 (+),score=73.45 TRINITY_DN1962_c0_g1_i2:68-997(+)